MPPIQPAQARSALSRVDPARMRSDLPVGLRDGALLALAAAGLNAEEICGLRCSAISMEQASLVVTIRRHGVTLRIELPTCTLPLERPGSSGNNLSQMHRSGDWIRFVLDRPMMHPPGKRFRYNSGGTMVSAAVLKRVTGLNADEFAQRYLFKPLGIRDADWRYRSPDGLPETGGGLFLTPRDMSLGRAARQPSGRAQRVLAACQLGGSSRGQAPASGTRVWFFSQGIDVHSWTVELRTEAPTIWWIFGSLWISD